MTKFQIILISIFIVFIVIGVATFALFKKTNTQNVSPTITIWGLAPADEFNQFVIQLNSTLTTPMHVNYVQESESSFQSDFVNALAIGNGPDVILIPNDMLLQNENKITPIPYTLISQRTFEDTYVPEADLYLNTAGIEAIPFYIDPLVMYWNRDSFTNAGIATAGTVNNALTWATLAGYGPKLTDKDVNANIRKSVMALGQFSNVDNAREILGTLMMQAGNPVTEDTTADGIVSAIGNGAVNGLDSASQAVSFFTQFANPTSQYYSWNSSLPDSETYFLAGNLATYFGFASELSDIRNKNPNLNFDVAPLPQATNGKNRITYGHLYGFSIVKSSPNASAAYADIMIMEAPTALAQWQTASYLPPVTRSAIAAGTTDPDMAIFYDGALIARGWLDPNPFGTETIWQNMVQSIVSGASTINNAVQAASQAMNLEIKNM